MNTRREIKSLGLLSVLDEEPPSTKLSVPGMARERKCRNVDVTTVNNDKTKAFRSKYFPEVTDQDWDDWHWQIKNRIRTHMRIREILKLAPEEMILLNSERAKLPAGITPYYMSLLQADDANHPLRRCVIPTVHELQCGPGEADDPLGEEGDSPVPGIVHRYPDRALLLVLDFCSTYCRYCTRSRVVGHGDIKPTTERLERAIDYIRATPQIRDVVVSGGDPLMLANSKLDWLLSRLRAIPHVEIIRIGTKVTTVLPQRINPALVRVLRRYHPLWMSLHFIHPEECTPEAYRACALLANAGIPLGSQTVLLKGINDNVETMKELMHHLLKMRVRPYYLYQCDPITGSAHFRTSVEKGLEIIQGLRGHTSGYGVPTYVIDAPGGGGKIPLMPEYVAGREGDDLILRNYQGELFRYPDPAGKKKTPC
ncbi:MAG: KamA family radical SAM protein [Planctomycetes bacterium]|nr:KamA family radical SAM protein [Planctomycetota bacterium]